MFFCILPFVAIKVFFTAVALHVRETSKSYWCSCWRSSFSTDVILWGLAALCPSLSSNVDAVSYFMYIGCYNFAFFFGGGQILTCCPFTFGRCCHLLVSQVSFLLLQFVQLERLAIYHDSDKPPWKVDKSWQDLTPSEWIEVCVYY